MSEAADRKRTETVNLIAVTLDGAVVSALEGRLTEMLHLKPQWERLLVADAAGCCTIGLPIAAKITADSVENHARHLFSLLNVLGVGIPAGSNVIRRIESPKDAVRPLRVPEAALRVMAPTEGDDLD